MPFGEVYADRIARASSRNVRYKAALKAFWLSEGELYRAPYAQLILYPKYPEVRMSGLLRGCSKAPSDVLAARDPGRILFLGVTVDQRIIAHAAFAEDPIVRELETQLAFGRQDLLIELALSDHRCSDGRTELIGALTATHAKGWIESYRLDASGSKVSCNSTNCGGYTLEAELGITPNGYSEPDFCGWELKQHNVTDVMKPQSGSAITLMTPEPKAGYYMTHGVEAFVRRFGYGDTQGRPDRLNFGGVYRIGHRHKRTELVMEMTGYNVETGKIEDLDGGLSLLSREGEVAATWLFSDLIDHWKRKHALAAYVPSKCKTVPKRMYRYGPLIRLGSGADFNLLLKSFAAGLVYYDPGIKIEAASTDQPRAKRRNQFRTHCRDISELYESMEQVDLKS